MLPDEIEAGIRRIQADNTSGAVELVRRAADLLKTAGREPALIRELCLAVVSAQPVMAPMVSS